MAEQEDKGAILVQALADYYDTDPENILGFVVGCEREDEEMGVTLSTAWSIGTPYWHHLAYIDEMKHQVERNYRSPVPQEQTKGKPRDRQQPRGRRGRR